MKILFVASKYDYGIPQRGFSYEHYNFYDTFINMGFETIYFDFISLLNEFGIDKMNNLLIEYVEMYKPDLMFCVLFQNQIRIDTLSNITSSKKTITFNWFCDDHWRFDNFSKYYAPCFNWVATTSQSAISKYQYIGYKNVIKTQWGVNHYLYKRKKIPLKYKVSFVGAPHGERRKIINLLKKNNIDCNVWGTGWDLTFKNRVRKKLHLIKREKYESIMNKTRLSLEDMIVIFLQSKINLNLSASSKTEYEDQIKGRTFEVPACGSFLLSGYADNLEEYFNIGKEIVCFKDFKNMVELIVYYLKHEKE